VQRPDFAAEPPRRLKTAPSHDKCEACRISHLCQVWVSSNLFRQIRFPLKYVQICGGGGASVYVEARTYLEVSVFGCERRPVGVRRHICVWDPIG
jgi:hypothetical protein